MDDSCENDVPPPEANEPFSEVPPSDQGSAANAKRADKSGKKREGENLTEWERISLELGRKPVFDYDKTLPSYDGFLNSDLFGRKIPFHYIQIMPGPCDAEFAYSMNMFAAQLICNVVDIFRGRQKEARVERVLSEVCMRKLRNASAQIAAQMKKDVRIYAQLGLLPITVYYVDSWLVSPTCFESTVLMGIGGRRLCSNLKCVLKGSAWKCEVADFGV